MQWSYYALLCGTFSFVNLMVASDVALKVGYREHRMYHHYHYHLIMDYLVIRSKE